MPYVTTVNTICQGVVILTWDADTDEPVLFDHACEVLDDLVDMYLLEDSDSVEGATPDRYRSTVPYNDRYFIEWMDAEGFSIEEVEVWQEGLWRVEAQALWTWDQIKEMR